MPRTNSTETPWSRAPRSWSTESPLYPSSQLANVARRDAVVPELDQRCDRAKLVSERAQLANEGGLHAVLTGLHQIGRLGLRVPLRIQLVQKCVPHVVAGQLVLLRRRWT